MDYSSYNDYEIGEHYYYPSPYTCSHNMIPLDSTFDFVDHGSYHYDPTPCYSPAAAYSTFSYSASAITEPHVVYEHPTSYSIHYCNPSSTQFGIYYSVSEFNETDFEEYDPTPYGGGYDISATYGKPLPPSDETCYPRTLIGPVESSYGKEEGDEEKPAKPTDETKPSQADQGKDERHDEIQNGEQGNDKKLGFEEGGDHNSESQNGLASEDHGYGEKIVGGSYMPSGYGLEAMDLCETIFGGYFPCLARNKRLQNHNYQEAPLYGRNDYDLWKGTSDYLFGDSNPYGDGRGYEEPIYGYYPYRRHFHEQPVYQFQKVEYEEDDGL